MAHDQHPEKAQPLILASASPRRRVLLRTFGLPFRVVTPRVNETHDRRVPPAKLVQRNAVRKAEAAARALASGVIVAADTLVVLDGRIFGKPRTARQADRMLRVLSGRTHRVYTGVCTLDLARRRRYVDVASTRVTMRGLSDGQIRRYLRGRAPWDKAGAYAVQDMPSMLIDRVDGSLSNVVGLPLHLVERRLRQCGLL